MSAVLGGLLLAYVAAAAASGASIMRRVRGLELTGRQRVGLYVRAMAQSWCVALLLGGIRLAGGGGFAQLGLPMLPAGTYRVPAVVALVAAGLALAFLVVEVVQAVTLARSVDARREAWESLSEGAHQQPALMVLLPRTLDQRRVYFAVAATAGICEEFIFRGLMFAVIHDLLPEAGFVAPLLISSVLFGLAHTYQAVAGIAKTGLMGLLLGGLYISTGSLLPGMVLHAVVDASSGFLAPKPVPLAQSHDE